MITLEFIIVQLAIGILGYIIHQWTRFNIGPVLIIVVTMTSLVSLITLESKHVFVHILDIFPSHAIGFGTGLGITTLIHWIRGEL
jgi:hypothetical protein